METATMNPRSFSPFGWILAAAVLLSLVGLTAEPLSSIDQSVGAIAGLAERS
jgi:hypothetical protein